MSGDTNDLLLQEIERAVRIARAWHDAERWEEAAVQIGFAGVQAQRLATSLWERVKSLASIGAGIL